MTRVSKLHRESRYLPDFWRHARVPIRLFRVSLLAFAILTCAGTLAFRSRHIHLDTGQGLNLGESLYATLMLALPEVQLPFPTDPDLRMLFFAVPICGSIVAAECFRHRRRVRRRLEQPHHRAGSTRAQSPDQGRAEEVRHQVCQGNPQGICHRYHNQRSGTAAPTFTASAPHAQIGHSFNIGGTCLASPTLE